MARLQHGAEGFDYGSGPRPTLSVMLEERGFRMAIYDPFFAPDERALARTYDFITCTETAEHFFDPAAEFARLDSLLRPGGWLGVMTQMLDDAPPLEQWRCSRDPTHVCFYRRATFAWLADLYGWEHEFVRQDVVLIYKPR